MNVLVIEDEPTSLKLEHLVLAADGNTVRDADSATTALEVIRKEKPAVILLDLALPGMHGLSLAQALRADPETRDIHIVAVTAYPDQFTRAQALAAGCDAYIVKPINTRTLSNQLAGVVGGKGPAGSHQGE
jgi:CheY-like chemotaxis protein